MQRNCKFNCFLRVSKIILHRYKVVYGFYKDYVKIICFFFFFCFGQLFQGCVAQTASRPSVRPLMQSTRITGKKFLKPFYKKMIVIPVARVRRRGENLIYSCSIFLSTM